MYNFRPAVTADLPQIATIIAQCQALLRARGVDQWQDGYPSQDVIELDIECSWGYILECDGRVAAYGALIAGIEPAYLEIRGEWLSDLDYITLHRLAVSDDFRGQGVGAHFFEQMACIATARNIKSLRADTHCDNMLMQRLLSRSGFHLCGDVYYRGMQHRLAFERLL